MSNSNVIGPSSGTSTAVGSKSGSLIADKLLVLGDLGQAVHQQRALDLVGHVLAEAGFDQLAQARPGRKPGTAAEPIMSLNALSK